MMAATLRAREFGRHGNRVDGCELPAKERRVAAAAAVLFVQKRGARR
jgi:hypothetical protein